MLVAAIWASGSGESSFQVAAEHREQCDSFCVATLVGGHLVVHPKIAPGVAEDLPELIMADGGDRGVGTGDERPSPC